MTEASKPGSTSGSAETLASTGAGLGYELPPLRPVDVDRYELLGEHGRGGLGVIIRAVDRQLGREVAIKLLQNPSPEAGARFLREATITSRLQHPSIVTVLDVVRWIDGMPSYTMPLYPGESLKAAITSRPRLADRLLLLPRVLAVAEALAHAHERRIVHRDVKPANVLLGQLGETVVIDWGLAKSLDDTSVDLATGSPGESPVETLAGRVLGTPAYMPPEQAAGERVDERADVYALGAVLYHVLTGEAPRLFVTTAELLEALAPRVAPARQPGVPVELVAILKKAMAGDREDRYREAGALAADLRRFLAGHLVEAHAYSPAQLAWRWLSRHRALAGVALALLVGIVAITVVSFRGVQREQALARAEAGREESRANRLVLEQARSLLDRDPTSALAWLKSYPDDGLEWRRLRGLAREALWRGVARHVFWPATLGDHEPLPLAGGSSFALAGSRRELYHFDLVSGAARAVCLPAAVRTSPQAEAEADELVVGLDDGQVLVLDAELNRRSTLAVWPGVRAASLSSDGRFAAIAGEVGPATLIDRQTGIETPFGSDVQALQFVPGSDRLVVSSARGRVEIYAAGDGQVVHAAAPNVLHPWVSPHGRHVVLVRRTGLEWLDTESFASHALAARPSAMRPIGVFPDGRVALSERGKSPKVWTPATGQVEDLTGTGGPTAASPDGKLVALLGSGELRLLEPGGTPRLLRMPVAVLSRAVEFVGSAWAVSSAEGDALRVWSTASPRGELVALGGREFAPDYAVVDGGRVLVAGAQDGRVIRQRLGDGSPIEELCRLPAPVSNLASGGDGGHGVAIDGQGRLVAWQAGGEPRVIARDVPVLDQLILGPGERHVIGYSFSAGLFAAWELASGRELRVEQLVECTEAAFSPDGRTAIANCSARDDGFTRLDLVAMSAALLPLPAELEAQVLGFSPSGQHYFVGTGRGALVRFRTDDWSRETRASGRRAIAGGLPLSDELVLTAGEEGLFLASFVGIRFLIDGDRRPVWVTVAEDRAYLAGRSPGGMSVWDLSSFERGFMVPGGGDARRTRLVAGGKIVNAYLDGSIRVWSPNLDVPGPSPAATRAWLEASTNQRLGDEDAVRLGCD